MAFYKAFYSVITFSALMPNAKKPSLVQHHKIAAPKVGYWRGCCRKFIGDWCKICLFHCGN